MKKRILIPVGVIAVGLIIYAAIAAMPSIRLEVDFRDGAEGWEAGFAEYSPETEDMMQLEAATRPLPSELGISANGYHLRGMNHSDDLFMFLKRRLGTGDGVMPGQEYRVVFTIIFASNAPSGAAGIGGSPGESVYLKAGASAVEPEVYLDSADNHYHMNVDKGEGNNSDGTAASVIGNIANGLSAEEDPRYVSLKRRHAHEQTVTASQDGEFWVLVGTDSGFEGLTSIYYQSIVVTLNPVR